MSLPPWEQRARQQTRPLFTDPAAPAPPHANPAPPQADPAPPPAPPTPAASDVDITRAAEPLGPERISLHGRLTREWAGTSLRARLLGILVVALLGALALTGYGVQAAVRGFLIGQLDTQLQRDYQRVTHQDNVADLFRGAGPGPLNTAATQVTITGHPELSATNVPEGVLGPSFRALSFDEATNMNGRPFDLPQSGGGPAWRAVALPVTLGGLPGSVTLARSTAAVDESVDRVRLLTLLIGGLAILLCTFLGWLAIRRAFVPLRDVEVTAAAIAAGDLSQRIPERPATTEVGRLTSSLNGMLTQIESAFRARQASEARTKRFAADASHELRTPLASIRGFAELYRQGAVPADEVPRTMRRIEDEAKRMGGLVEDLLMLARLDEQRPGRSDQVDLAVLAGDAVHDAHGLAPERSIRLVGLDGTSGPAPAVTIGDEDRLRQVVGNLMANAVRHTPPGTPIEVAVGLVEPARQAVVEVRDHGSGLSPEQAERVFERFYRLDSSRQRGQGGGSGLGLSIVSAVVASHQGQVEVRPTPGGGATFVVSLPGAPTS